MAIGTTAALIMGASAIGSAAISANAASKAANAAKNLQYQPIDLNALQQQAQGFAEQNLQKSIALEREYMPELSAARFGLQKQVAQDLERGGQLPLDVANQVTRASMAQAGAGGFGAGPLTAAQLGLTSFDIRQRALDRAAMLSENSPLPVSGLDPGSLASAAIGQNQQMNQFNMDKTAAISRANQSKADAWAGGLSSLGKIASMWTPGSSLGGSPNLVASNIGGYSTGPMSLAATSGYGGSSLPTTFGTTVPGSSFGFTFQK